MGCFEGMADKSPDGLFRDSYSEYVCIFPYIEHFILSQYLYSS